MKKRICSLVFLIMMFLVLMAPEIKASETNVSGNISVSQPTKIEIQKKWKEVKQTNPEFKSKPSVTAPYKAGALTDNFLKSGISYLNFIRYVAHIPSVNLSADMTADAQYGAVLMAANNELSHYPAKPKNMSQEFYERGYNATSSSNISCGYSNLAGAIQGCMNDSDSGNISAVGHRRWLLSPGLTEVGFGYAESSSGYSYITTKVFGSNFSYNNFYNFDYNYISWPSSGNFPNNVFDKYTPWSISLNSSKYEKPDMSKVKVTLTRKSDGKKWVFSSSCKNTSYNEPYFNVNNGGYGIPNCIIFRPSADAINVYDGIYTVTITGITTTAGKAVTLTYQVDFFNLNEKLFDITTQPKTTSVKNGETAKISIKAVGSNLSYTWYVKKPGASKYTKSSVTGTTYSAKMSNATKNTAVYCVIKDKYGNTQKSNVVYLRMAPTITTQPKTTYAKLGATAKVTVKASGEGLTYTWYIKNAGESKYTKSSIKNATYSIKMSNAKKDCALYCVVKDKYGSTVKTKVVYLRMKASITTQPKTTYTKLNATAKVTIKAAGDGLKYTWYVKNAGETKYTKSSVTGSTYTIKMTAERKNRVVYCVVKDKYGNSVKSNAVYLKMAATITAQPKTVTVKSGTAATVTVKAAGDGLTYTWYVKNPGESKYTKSSAKYIKSSATSSSYSARMSSSTKNRSVYCVVKDKYGKTVKSSAVTLQMK